MWKPSIWSASHIVVLSHVSLLIEGFGACHFCLVQELSKSTTSPSRFLLFESSEVQFWAFTLTIRHNYPFPVSIHSLRFFFPLGYDHCTGCRISSRKVSPPTPFWDVSWLMVGFWWDDGVLERHLITWWQNALLDFALPGLKNGAGTHRLLSKGSELRNQDVLWLLCYFVCYCKYWVKWCKWLLWA